MGSPASRQTAPGGPTAVHILWRVSLLSPMTLWVRSCGVGGVESGGQVRGCLEGEEVFVGVLVRSRGESVLAVVQHVSRIGGREGAGLGAEVQEDGVGLPPPQGTDGGFIHAGDEEGSGAPRAKAVRDDAVGGDVGDVLDGGSSLSEGGGDVAGGDVMGNAHSVEVAVERAVGGGVVLAEVEDPSLCCPDRAEGGVTGEAVSKGLAAGGILLVSVGETNMSPGLHVMRRALSGGCPLGGGTAKGGVAKAEGLAPASVGGGGEGVFARSAKEIKAEDGEVGNGMRPALVGVEGEGRGECPEDGDVDGPHSGGSGVVIGPSLEEGAEAEGVPGPIQPGIREAQSGELLADGT